MANLELLTTEEMGRADRLAVAAGVPSLVLMENAGRAVADEVLRMVPPPARIAVLCGPGNNGGDGFVAGRLLMLRGYSVRLALLSARAGLAGDAAVMAGRWTGPVEPWRAVPELLAGADLIVDAMFGAGLTRPLDGEAATAAALVNASVKPVLAVDVPSGLDGNSGAPAGTMIKAMRTVTFFRRKPGHLLMPGRAGCGDVIVADIGIPGHVIQAIAPNTFANGNERAIWASTLRRTMTDHKYTRGHAVVVSGPPDSTGAARLAARGALRIGAGLCTVASPSESLTINAARLTAIMVKPFEAPAGLAEILADPRRNAVLLGPGGGVGAAMRGMVEIALCSHADVVLDADALTSFSGALEQLRTLLAQRRSMPGAALSHAEARRPGTVLTPHEGEFKRLFGELPGSKLERARVAARSTGAVIVLKGPDTVIASPDGTAVINENAPPTLATAGSGDVMAGFITGLMAQRMSAFQAACAAVWLHGECASLLGPGLISEDVPEVLPRVLARLLGWSPPAA